MDSDKVLNELIEWLHEVINQYKELIETRPYIAWRIECELRINEHQMTLDKIDELKEKRTDG